MTFTFQNHYCRTEYLEIFPWKNIEFTPTFAVASSCFSDFDDNHNAIMEWCSTCFIGRFAVRPNQDVFDQLRETDVEHFLSMVDIFIEKEEDAVLFRLRWM